MRAVRSGILFALLWWVAGNPADADEPWSFVQITCTPELSYFAVQRFTIMNPPPKGPYLTEGLDAGPEQVVRVQNRYGIFDSTGLKTHPYSCQIPAVPRAPGWNDGRPAFDVQVVGHNDGPNTTASSYRMITDDVEIFLDGKSIASIGLNPYGAQFGPDTISVSPDGVEITITRCEIDTAEPRDLEKKHLTCVTTSASQSK